MSGVRSSLGNNAGRLARSAVYRAPVLRGAAARFRPRACVLLYHRIATPPSDPFGQAVSPERFARQLEAVRSRYHVMSAGELVGRLRGHDYPDGTVAVTFDDGYADTLAAAYPVASACGVPIHVFVTIGPIAAGADAFWWDELSVLAPTGKDGFRELHDELRRLPAGAREARLGALRNGRPRPSEGVVGRPLTAAELVELASLPLVALGGHTVSHPALGGLPLAEQLVELSEGRARLEQLAGVPVDVLSYPFGKEADVSRETRELAAKVGYAAAFLSTPRAVVPSSDRFALPRLAVHDWPADVLLARIAEVLGPVRV
jgi:peptidoglycan/xylan/chitin deacetylase (PgdA/CDA1 family)